MIPFQQPHASARKDGKYVLHETYHYWCEEGPGVGSGWALRILKGFIWDGASIPRVFWTMSGIRPGGRMVGPSLVHDYLYRGIGGEIAGDYTRKEADQLFRHLMLEAGMGKMRARWAYQAVRLFGRWAWKGK